jgi:hypothetical protein
MGEHGAEGEAVDTMPTGQWCPIGSLNLHTYNHERTECIWCGPGRLAWQEGRWIDQGDGRSAWSVTPPGSGDNDAGRAGE